MDFYERAASASVLPPGHSSYFESPHRSLDPYLFDGEHLRPEVRERLLVELEEGLNEQLNLAGVNEWLHAWLAGSGITYQWQGGEGDLDVLFGVDMLRFTHWNPGFQGIPEKAVAQWADDKLKATVWPKTSRTRFGQRTYEVTFFWNPGTGNDIERIKPYAAYDLKSDTWAHRPPDLPVDPTVLYPQEWYRAAGSDVDAAESLLRRHALLTNVLSGVRADSPESRTTGAELTRVLARAKALFDDIHIGRRQAFGEQGHGYSDWHNFRWQHAKATGVVTALRRLEDEQKTAVEREQKMLYGGPIDAPDTILTREMLRYGNRP